MSSHPVFITSGVRVLVIFCDGVGLVFRVYSMYSGGNMFFLFVRARARSMPKEAAGTKGDTQEKR